MDIYTWARNIVIHKPLILDTETTSLGNDAEVIDLAIIDIDGVPLLDTLIQCQGAISPSAFATHGISKEMLTTARAFPQVCNELFEIIKGHSIITYNANFDHRVLMQTASRYGLAARFSVISFICLMLPYAEHYGEPGYYGGYKWQKLEIACREFDIMPGSHRAKDDAEAARQVLLKLALL